MCPFSFTFVLLIDYGYCIVIGTADELTGQAVHAFATLKLYVSLSITSSTVLIFSSEFTYDHNNERELVKELILQVRKVIGPFATPKASTSSRTSK